MWTYGVLQNQWLVLAFFGGVVILMGVVLTCLSLWRPRGGVIDEDDAVAGRHNVPVRQWASFMPWLLVATFAAFVVYSVGYVLYMAHRPPNW